MRIMILAAMLFGSLVGCKSNQSAYSFLQQDSADHYSLGSEHPIIRHDYGSGVWDSKDWTYQALAELQAVKKIAAPAFSVAVGKDAARHMQQYLANKGKSITIRLDQMLVECLDAKHRYRQELNHAMRYAETLPVGSFRIMATKPTSGYCHKKDSENWYLATGGYANWGSALVIKSCDGGGDCQYTMFFTFHYFDRYNWDGGKTFNIAGRTITDKVLAEWHRMGLAQEFNMFGDLTHIFKWKDSDGERRNSVHQQLKLLRLTAKDAKLGKPYQGQLFTGPSKRPAGVFSEEQLMLGRTAWPAAARPKFIVQKGPKKGTYIDIKKEENLSVFGTQTKAKNKNQAGR
jgi:hypothetical protein